MIKSKLILFIVFFLFYSNLFSQNYFQQEVNYTIDVRLDVQKNELFADETIQYINNSPDTLRFIYFHLWVNAYKNNQTALCKQMMAYGNDALNKSKPSGYIDSLDFKINNQKVVWNFLEEYIDICKIELTEPLLSGDTIIITTPFHVKIPSNEISRMGCDSESYQITQWYPKPAVYDKNGWNQMPYLDYGEYYSEFGSFDVSITIPKQYVVAATGNLKNNSELNWLNKLAEKNITGAEYDNPSEKKNKTIRYTEDNIHDFAWFANKNYFVDKSSVKLANSDKEVTTWTFYTERNESLWKKATQYINDAIYYNSIWVGDYPYNNCTAVEGGLRAGGGMEYPTITVISSGWNDFSLERVIVHEVTHNWFYGIFGFNERIFPFLDEGLTSLYETRYVEKKYPDKNYSSRNNIPYHYTEYKIYRRISNSKENYPLDTKTTDMKRWTYYSIAYGKAAHSFWYLMSYMGEEFDKIMQLFFNEWKFKHPQPEDLHNHFKKNTKKDIDWFFEDVVKTVKIMDYAAIKIKNNKLLVKNNSMLICPISITGFSKDEIVYDFLKNGFENKKWIQLPDISIDKLIINYNYNTIDMNKNNNEITP